MQEFQISKNNNEIIISENNEQIILKSNLSKINTITLLRKYIKDQATINENDFNNMVYTVNSNEDWSCLYFLNSEEECIFIIDFKNEKLFNLKNLEASQSYISKLNFNNINIDTSIEWFNNFHFYIRSDFIYYSNRDYSTNRYYLEAFKDFNKLKVCEILAKQGFKNKSWEFNRAIIEPLYNKIKNNEKFKINEIFKLSKYHYNLLQKIKLLNYTSFYYDDTYINMFKEKNSIYFEYLLKTYGLNKSSNSSNLSVLIKYNNLFIHDFIKNNYNLNKLIDYINIDCDHQGIEYKTDAIQLLIDYVNMNLDMEITNFEKYPRYLKTYHDIILKNYKIKLDEIKVNKFNKLKESKNYLQYDKNNKQKKNQYIVSIPNTLEEIVKEGSSLNHCVASYIDKVIEDKSFICFMRYKSKPLESLITLEIIDNKIVHAKGQQNRNPSQEELKFLEEYQRYLDNKNIFNKKKGVINE